MRRRRAVTTQSLHRIRELKSTLTDREIANELGVGIHSVRYAMSSLGIVRTPEESHNIRSRVRKDLIRSEKRRLIFGFEQKTKLKVFANKERNSLRSRLRRKGYILFPRDNTVYYNSETRRKEEYEAQGKRLGLKFVEQT